MVFFDIFSNSAKLAQKRIIVVFLQKKTLCYVKAFSSSLREFTKVSFFCNKCISAVALLYIVGIYDTSFFARYWSITFRLQVRNKDEERRQAELLSPFYLFIQGYLKSSGFQLWLKNRTTKISRGDHVTWHEPILWS